MFAEILHCGYFSSHEHQFARHQSSHNQPARRMQKTISLKPNDQLVAKATLDGILLRPADTVPLEMYTDARLAEFEAAEADLAAAVAKHAAAPSTASTGEKERTASRKA